MIESLASGAVLLFLDQWSKMKVQLCLPDRCISYGPILRIRCVTNLDSVHKRKGARGVLVWVLALASAIILHRSGAWFQGHVALFGLGLAFGGAAGNLLDILRRGCIVDFIDLRWWPVFNLADAAIVAGLVVALWPQA